MTYFGQLLVKAVQPNTKLAQAVKIVSVSRFWSQEQWDKEIAARRGFSLNKAQWAAPRGTLANPSF